MFPLFFENSKVPVILSSIPFVPININAITIAFCVFSVGEIDKTTKNHESIHWAQYKECLILLFPLLYGISYLINLCKRMTGAQAYREIWFEREAYKHQADPGYLSNRRLYEWARK